MNDIQDLLMDTILDTLSEKIDPKILKRANTRKIKRKLLKRLTDEFFYKLFNEKKVNLAPGFGSVVLKKIKEKDKKIFNKKIGTMTVKHINGHKVIYKPGDSVRELL